MLNFNKTKSEHRLSDREITDLLNRAAFLEAENTRVHAERTKLQTKLTYAETMVNYHRTMAEANLDARMSLEAEVKRLNEEIEGGVPLISASAAVERETVDERETIDDDILDEGREANERMNGGGELPQINLSPGEILRPPTMRP